MDIHPGGKHDVSAHSQPAATDATPADDPAAPTPAAEPEHEPDRALAASRPQTALHRPMRAVVALVELALAAALVVVAVWAWRRAAVPYELPVTDNPAVPRFVNQWSGPWVGAAFGLTALAGVLVLDALRQLVLSARTRAKHQRRHASPTRPTVDRAGLADERAGGTLAGRLQVVAEARAPQDVGSPASAGLFRRAVTVIPGGVNSPVRAFGAVGGTPRFMARGEGAHLVDADGVRYVDLVCSWGPMILGHAHQAVVDAVREVAGNGLSFGAPTEREVELAELIVDRIEPVESVRLVNSGTEATMSAIRLARGASGRRLVIKFAGHYHGHVDALLASAGSGVATFGLPSSPGVVGATDTIVLPYNDIPAVSHAFAEHGDAIACVITEAAAGNMGVVAPAAGFNAALRELCDANGALLVIDEVMTGFRVGPAGWYGLEGVAGDLYTFGKVMSGGLPAAAFGGRADVMAQLAPQGPVYQAGTLSGNPVAVAAGLATLRTADAAVYAAMDANARRLGSLLSGALTREGVPHRVQEAGNLLSVFFTERPVTDFAGAQAADTWRFGPLFHALLQHGVYPPPSAFEAWFVSAALSDQDFEVVETALRHAAKAAASAQRNTSGASIRDPR